MEILTLLFILTASLGALNVLARLTSGVAQWHRQQEAYPPGLPERPAVQSACVTPSRLPLAAEETVGHWWKTWCSLPGMLGLCAGPVQPCILVINSYLIALTLEVVFASSGVPLLPVSIAGWERDLSTLDLIGALISLLQMLLASALYLSWRKRLWFPCGAALVGLLALVVFEVVASYHRGRLLEGGELNAYFSALLALGVAAAEIVLGVFFIDHCVLPLMLVVLWTFATPVRRLAHWRDDRPATPHTWLPTARGLTAPVAALDAVFEPLRWIDRTAGRLLPQRLRGQNKGGEDHVARPKIQPPFDHQSANGHQPVGLRSHRDETV